MSRDPLTFDHMTVRTSGGQVRVSFANSLDRPWSDPVTMELRFTSLGEAIQSALHAINAIVQGAAWAAVK